MELFEFAEITSISSNNSIFVENIAFSGWVYLSLARLGFNLESLTLTLTALSVTRHEIFYIWTALRVLGKAVISAPR